jgi:hypothetical protein
MPRHGPWKRLGRACLRRHEVSCRPSARPSTAVLSPPPPYHEQCSGIFPVPCYGAMRTWGAHVGAFVGVMVGAVATCCVSCYTFIGTVPAPPPFHPPEQHKVPSVLYGYDATGKEERVLLWLDEVCVCVRP